MRPYRRFIAAGSRWQRRGGSGADGGPAAPGVDARGDLDDGVASGYGDFYRFIQIFTDFCRFFGLSWETSTLKNYHPEDSKHSGSGRIEFSSKSTTFLM